LHPRRKPVHFIDVIGRDSAKHSGCGRCCPAANGPIHDCLSIGRFHEPSPLKQRRAIHFCRHQTFPSAALRFILIPFTYTLPPLSLKEIALRNFVTPAQQFRYAAPGLRPSHFSHLMTAPALD
jgi:hypothetical protein